MYLLFKRIGAAALADGAAAAAGSGLELIRERLKTHVADSGTQKGVLGVLDVRADSRTAATSFSDCDKQRPHAYDGPNRVQCAWSQC